jgi:hypothetical protein
MRSCAGESCMTQERRHQNGRTTQTGSRKCNLGNIAPEAASRGTNLGFSMGMGFHPSKQNHVHSTRRRPEKSPSGPRLWHVEADGCCLLEGAPAPCVHLKSLCSVPAFTDPAFTDHLWLSGRFSGVLLLSCHQWGL